MMKLDEEPQLSEVGHSFGLRGWPLRRGSYALRQQVDASSRNTGFPLSVFDPQRWREVRLALGLTARQLAIAQLIFSECTTKAMAERLGISENTVETHMKALYKRLGVQTRVGVVLQLVRTDRALSNHGADADFPESAEAGQCFRRTCKRARSGANDTCRSA